MPTSFWMSVADADPVGRDHQPARHVVAAQVLPLGQVDDLADVGFGWEREHAVASVRIRASAPTVILCRAATRIEAPERPSTENLVMRLPAALVVVLVTACPDRRDRVAGAPRVRRRRITARRGLAGRVGRPDGPIGGAVPAGVAGEPDRGAGPGGDGDRGDGKGGRPRRGRRVEGVAVGRRRPARDGRPGRRRRVGPDHPRLDHRRRRLAAGGPSAVTGTARPTRRSGRRSGRSSPPG